MAYYLNLSCGSGYVWDAAGGTLICSPAGPNAVIGALPGGDSLTASDIGLLLTIGLTIFAVAWGFRVVGSLLYRSS